jgi:hypothetical protein
LGDFVKAEDVGDLLDELVGWVQGALLDGLRVASEVVVVDEIFGGSVPFPVFSVQWGGDVVGGADADVAMVVVVVDAFEGIGGCGGDGGETAEKVVGEGLIRGLGV